MEKKKPTTSNPTGVCEKLFNAISPTFRPIRHLTFRRSDPESNTDVTNPPPTLPSANGGAKPEPVTLAPEKKPKPVAMPHEKAKATPATTAPEKKPKPVVMPAPAAAPERSKTNINEKVGDYISRVRAKMRTGSGVGRAPSS